MLRACGADNYVPVDTPLKPGKRLTVRDCPSFIDPTLQRRYRMILGFIGFMVQMTRPDLAFAYCELSKFLSCPGQVHMTQAERCLAYIKGTIDYGITYDRPKYPSKVNRLEAFVDSDYAADPDTRRSVTGYLIILNNGPVAWKSKRQSCVTLSSAEAEFVAATTCAIETLYLRSLLRGFGHRQPLSTTLWEDNASAIAMAENPVAPDKSRHIDTRYYFLREMDRAHVVKLRKIDTADNVADALTKSLPGPTFTRHISLIMGDNREYLMARPIPTRQPQAPLLPSTCRQSRVPPSSMKEYLNATLGPDYDPTPFNHSLILAAAA